MARRLEECLAAVENPEGKKQKRLFKRKRGGTVLTKEQVAAIKEGRKLLRQEKASVKRVHLWRSSPISALKAALPVRLCVNLSRSLPR